MKVSVVGLGKLGSPLLAFLAAKGFDTFGVDQNPNFVAAVQSGRAPVSEPGLQELFDSAGSRIRATDDISEAVTSTGVTFVVVPTPSKADAAFSNAHVIDAIEGIGAALRGKSGYHLVVITSTVMPGSTGGPIRQALERTSGRRLGRDLGLCYNPEFIALGSVVHDMLRPDFILIGESDAQAGDMLESIYAAICESRPSIQRMNFINAEIAKIAVNSFVTTKISFANMISGICERLPGADATVVTKAIGCDSRIGGKYLAPALGYGGPCFPRDNAAFALMANKVGASADIAEAADKINHRQVERVVSLVRKLLLGGTVGVLGPSYKPNTAVVEASQGVAIAAALAGDGYSVIVSDPRAAPAANAVLGGMVEMAPAADCAARSDLLIVATPWPEFRELPLDALRRAKGRLIVVDCWRLLPAPIFDEIVDLIYLGRCPDEGVGRDARGRLDTAPKVAARTGLGRN
jgi:UDPglucose 6-dehydrogenase